MSVKLLRLLVNLEYGKANKRVLLLVAPLELPRSLEHVELLHPDVEALLYSHPDGFLEPSVRDAIWVSSFLGTNWTQHVKLYLLLGVGPT